MRVLTGIARCGLVAALCLGAATAALAADAPTAKASLILTNGKVLTPKGAVQAMAIQDGVIVAVGDDQRIAAFRGDQTKIVDLKGAAVLPGLADMHVHSAIAGLEQFACQLKRGASPGEIAKIVSRCVKEKKPGEWISGGNWAAAGFKKGQQNRQFLDAIAPGNPVVLWDEAHHSLWVNSAALKAAGVTKAVADPAGGVIERDGDGAPTGLLRESAMQLVLRVVPPPSEQEMRAALMLSSTQMLSYGITAFTDALLMAPDAAMMSRLSAEGKLKQRIRGCMRWTPNGEDAAARGETLMAMRALYEQPRLKLDCVKITLDGVPTEARTAFMLNPYLGQAHGHGPNDKPEYGLPMIEPDFLNEAVTDFDRQGLTVKFHAAGDGAVREAMDAVAAARKANGWGGPAHDIAHNSFVDPVDIPRVRDLGMVWEFSPYIWYPAPLATLAVRPVIGEARMKRWIPIKDALDSGALVVAGSDWSVVPTVNPWLAIETMVTRQAPGGSKETLGAGQKVTLEQALRIFTENAAAHLGLRHLIGSIEPGMRADIIVVERSPFDVPIFQVHQTKVLKTFIDGELVYDAASPPRLTAH